MFGRAASAADAADSAGAADAAGAADGAFSRMSLVDFEFSRPEMKEVDTKRSSYAVIFTYGH